MEAYQVLISSAVYSTRVIGSPLSLNIIIIDLIELIGR